MDRAGLPTTIIAIIGLVIAIGGWINGCREIDQQREVIDLQGVALARQQEALRTEREARKREISLLQRQTELAGASLRPIVAPGRPVVRAYQTLPNGSARVTIAVVNQSSSLALRGRLSVGVFVGVLPPGILFDFFVPIEERARVAGFDALPARSRIVLAAVVPRRVLEAHTDKDQDLSFVLSYRDTAERVSRTAWTLDALRVGAHPRSVTFTISLR